MLKLLVILFIFQSTDAASTNVKASVHMDHDSNGYSIPTLSLDIREILYFESFVTRLLSG